MKIDMQDFLAAIAERKVALAIIEDETTIARLRNSGRRRTPEKRALLQCAALRASARGSAPVCASF